MKIKSKRICGLSILEDIIQVLCKKNMNLVQLQLQILQNQKINPKSEWLKGFLKKHKDHIQFPKNLITQDDCELIKNIDNWEIELKHDKNFIKKLIILIGQVIKKQTKFEKNLNLL